MKYPHNLAVIVPDNLWPAVVGMNAVLGWHLDDGVKLSATGVEPPTHRGVHVRAAADYVAMATGQVTPTIDGFAEAEIQAVVGQLHTNIETFPDNAFWSLASSLGLQVIPDDAA